MAKTMKGRAGRENKRDEIFEEYGIALSQLLTAQIRLHGNERVLHIGSAGATLVANQLAARLATGELIVYVYTFDELEDTRAALAGIGNVHVINDVDDIDEDEPPFDVVSCIPSYHLGRDTAIEQLEFGISRLAGEGTLYIAGDKQREFDRFAEALSSVARDVQQIAAKGQYRVVSVNGRNIRKAGRISGRRD
jgi:16S rRNA G1207 methylase RsmC